jgi:hypothetical protein
MSHVGLSGVHVLDSTNSCAFSSLVATMMTDSHFDMGKCFTDLGADDVGIYYADVQLHLCAVDLVVLIPVHFAFFLGKSLSDSANLWLDVYCGGNGP